MITVTNKATGEVIDLPTKTLNDLVLAWETAKQFEKLAKQIKDEVKGYALPHLNAFDETEEVGRVKFRRTVVQRYEYDKTQVRQIIEDEDLLDEFLVIDKIKLDTYVKANLAELGEISTLLRETLIPKGKPYEVFKLEKA
jgi:hypothetical protein